jgi:hypothetical protein
VNTFQSLGERVELGTHLHCEFIEPQRRLRRHNMNGEVANDIQKQYAPEIEAEKLANLTTLFRNTFGYAPTAFRAGRFGMSSSTLEILASLGYKVDSSVTPGLVWRYSEGVVDFQDWECSPKWVDTAAGKILEVPVSIRPASPLAPFVQKLPFLVRGASRRLIGRAGYFDWLRPSNSTGAQLIHYLQNCANEIHVLMFHSMEIIPKASPYAQTQEDVERIIAAMDALFAYCADHNYIFCGLTDVVNVDSVSLVSKVE